MKTMTSSLLKAGITALALTALFGTNAAFAQVTGETEIDRVRCKVDELVDDLGNPFNHVQIQVKVDTLEPVDVWVTNEFGNTSPVHYDLLPIDETATAEWDSSPDGIDPLVLIIDPGFAEPGEEITASSTPVGTATVTVECRLKVSGTFRQDTKPLKICDLPKDQKKLDRGKCKDPAAP